MTSLPSAGGFEGLPDAGGSSIWSAPRRGRCVARCVKADLGQDGAPQPEIASCAGDAINAAESLRPPSVTVRTPAPRRTSMTIASRCTTNARLSFRRNTHSCDAQIQSVAALSEKSAQPMCTGTEERTYSAISFIVCIYSKRQWREPISRFRATETRCA